MRKRLNLSMTKPVYERLKHLQVATGSENFTQTFQKAVAALDFVVGNEAAGREFFVKENGEYSKVYLLGMKEPT